MARKDPEAELIKKMRQAGAEKYGPRLVLTKYHGSRFGEAGVSDLLGTLDGIFVACEVKAPESYGGSVERALEKGPTDKQRAYVARVNRAGGVGWFAASVSGFMHGLAVAEATAQHLREEEP